MKGAIMQPYFFPYIGYYQLAYEVEKFVFLDDVNFIKKGYINRNAILLKGRRHQFSIPVVQVSQNRYISEHNYTGDFSSFLALVEQSYKKAPFYTEVFPIIQSVALGDDQNVARKNSKSLVDVFSYLGISRDFAFSSNISVGREYKAQEKILKICQSLSINQYRNAIGGKAIYSPEKFHAQGIEIKFIETHAHTYSQGVADFTPYLSMIDVLMHCDKETVRHLLSDYSLG